MAGKHVLLPQPSRGLFWGFAALVVLACWTAVATEWYFLAALPAVVLLIYQALVNWRPLYFLLLFFLPLSTEVELPNGFGTDLPTEPLMVGLMLLFIIHVFQRPEAVSARYLRHPITLVVLLHLFWTYTTTITSDLFFVSLKFSLAKTWYIVVFFFVTGYCIRSIDDLRRFYWVIYVPLFFTIAYVLVRHASYGFSFADVYKVFFPFQRNHVNYAAMLSLFVPFIILALRWYEYRSRRWWLLIGSLLLVLIAVYFSYTRAAYVSLLIALVAYFVVRARLLRPVLVAGLIIVLAGTAFFLYNNRYLDYAPNYETTVSHERFDNLIEATYNMEDISTMERLYRWVAAGHMIPERPIFGWGPGNFTNFYDSYTVTSFRTYVSKNEERSGIHNYFLLLFVEQGLPGLLLFIVLVIFALLYGESAYHRQTDPSRKAVLMASMISLIIILSFLIINDLVENDKIGSFFWINLALLVNFSRPPFR